MPATQLWPLHSAGVQGAGFPSRIALLSPARVAEPLGRGLTSLKSLNPGSATAGTKQQGAATSLSEARQAMSGNKARSNTASQRLPSPAEAPMRPVSQVLPDDALPLQLKQRTLSCEAVGAVLDNLHPGVRLNPTAGTDGAAVLGLASPVGSTSFLDLTLCKLSPGRMLACARSKLWWMTPEWRSSTHSLPPEVQFLLTELRPGGQGPYALLLPLIDGAYRATLRCAHPQGGSEGDLVLRVESGDDRVATDTWQALMHVSVGWDPYALVERGVTAAARLSGGAGALAQKVLPPSLDVFGWCTWDAFYSSVSAKGIQDGLRSLHANGVRPRFLIIDDGWQMTSLDPPETKRNPATSPSQLAERISWLDEKERTLLRNTDDEFYIESMEMLAEAAKTMPVGTSASTSMPMLSSLGPEAARVAAQHHQNEPQPKAAGTSAVAANGTGAAVDPAGTRSTVTRTKDDTKVDAFMVARIGQKLAGWVVGLGTAAFLLAYQWLVEPAPPNSLPVRTFAALANGPLRGAMLGFYSGASDFTRRLTSVKANAKFSSPDAGPEEPWEGKPADLGQVVTQLKAMFGLQYVYCWHGLPGYWAGIAPDSEEMSPYGSAVMYARPTPGVLEVEPSMAWNPAVLAGVGVLADPTPVYNAMHHYLASSGVDGVKVDCQAGVGLVGSALGGGPALSRRFHAALENSIATHFQDNHAINCMCHSTENLYRMRDTAVARASDDFYPRDPASSQPHIAACAYNSIFLSALVQPDWDMFHSKHAAARLHAIARAISGGGVYISDKPGEHDAALLRQLVLPDGSLLRCAGPGRPTRDCLFDDVLRDGKSALKCWNVNKGGPAAGPGARLLNGVVAAFNLQGSSWDRNRRKFYVHDPTPADLEVQVRPRDVEAFASLPAGAASTFVARAHGQPPTVLHTLGWSSALTLQLPAATAEMVTLAPVTQCGELSFAAVGWLNMLNSGGGITSVALTPGAGGVAGSTATVGVRGSGTLLMHSSHPPRSVRVCGVAMLSEWHAEYGTVSVEVAPTLDLTATVALEW